MWRLVSALIEYVNKRHLTKSKNRVKVECMVTNADTVKPANGGGAWCK